MLRCTPYIKSICDSLNNAGWLWRDGTSSLPSSPKKQAQGCESPTRSEGSGAANGVSPIIVESEKELIMFANLTADGGVKTTIVEAPSPPVIRRAPSAIKKFRPESPDLTRPAKKLEKSRNLGAISKVPSSPCSSSSSSSSNSHLTQTSGWLPPSDSWDSVATGILALPYGWETAQDKEGRTYYINHVNKTTSYEDPRKWDLESEPDPEPRSIELIRDSEMGFGFVAGSEKPVIVRFVTSGGPSVNKLMPGDQILHINGEDVKLAPRDHVIQLVRNCKEKVSLLVCQPPLDNSSTRKSALLSAAKKAKLKSNPSRVRFAESVDINGLHDGCGLPSNDSVVPLMPNVLKVFLENGQTKSFKYDGSTTVNDVIVSLQTKLGLKSTNYFSLVVEHIKSLRRNKLTLLDPRERLAQIASRPGAHNLRCLFRVTFVPFDACELLRLDPVAFEYLYVQSCNDVVQERFAPELQYDIALRLAALQIHQHVLSTSGTSIATNGVIPSSKVTVKTVEKECGLDRFVPTSLRDTMKRKELRKLLTHFLKLNSASQSGNPGGGTPKSQPQNLTALQAKIHYLKIIGDLPSYGAKCFSTNVSDSNVETVILVSPKFGVSQISNLRNSVPLNLCDIEQITSVITSKEDEISRKVDIQLKDPDKENIILSLEERDSKELILVLQGYFKLLTGRDLNVIFDNCEEEGSDGVKTSWCNSRDEEAPPYCSKHQVNETQGWNYPEVNMSTDTSSVATKFSVVEFGAHPPYHPPPDGFRLLPTQINHNSSDSGSDGDASMASSNNTGEQQGQQTNIMDRNSNITRLENNGNLNSPKHFVHNINNINNNLNRPNGILKKPSRTLSPHTNMKHSNNSFQQQILHYNNNNHNNNHNNNNNINNSSLRKISEKRAKDADTLERLAEMKEMVADAEEYLTDTSDPVTRNDSELSPTNYGKLKHSDSLTLLTQGKVENGASEAINKTLLISKTPLKDVLLNSDSECSTPAPSPARFSSNVKDGFSPSDPPTPPPPPPPQSSAASRLKSSDSSFGLHSPDNLPLGFDQEDDVKDLLNKYKTTTNDEFASGNLVLDPDLIDLTMIPPPMTPDEDGVYRVFPGTTNPVSTPPTPFADRQSLEAELKALEREAPVSSKSLEAGNRKIRDWKSSLKSSGGGELEEASGFKGFSNTLPQNSTTRDIDNFIANVTIPPPPASVPSFNPKEADIASYIIPPPPSSPMKVRGGSSSSSLAAQEIAPKIASLQKRLAHLTSPERSHPVSELKLNFRSSRNVEEVCLPKFGHVQNQAQFFNKHNHGSESPGGTSQPTSSSSAPPPPPPPPPPPRSSIIPPKKSQDSLHSLIASPRKLSSTPSTDSISSSMSTLKSVDDREEEEESEAPPSLPPRGTSMSPPPLSPSKPPLIPTSPKPVLPSRTKQLSRGLKISDSKPPSLPAKTLSSAGLERLVGRKLPIPPPSLKAGGNPLAIIDDDETRSSRALVFQKAEEVISKVVDHLKESESLLSSNRGTPSSEEDYRRAKERLTNESRQFVTASKLFVKSATESEGQLMECLHHCVQMIDRIGAVTREVVLTTPSPEATRDLISKVRDVAEIYMATVVAAGGGTDDTNMNILMTRATSLANVLTTLMRSLRVFN